MRLRTQHSFSMTHLDGRKRSLTLILPRRKFPTLISATRQSNLSESSGLVTKQVVDGYGRRYSLVQSAPQGKAVGFAISYDQYGKLTRIDSPAVMPALSNKPRGTPVQFEIERDELERVLSVRDARGSVSRSCYDGLRAARLDG
jgi:hypothetical protein